MAEELNPMLVDEQGLRALVHPLRVRLYERLNIDGPATASQLAERLVESSGATSYHLRQLARHGFIEEVPARGTKRERWWRVRPGGFTLNSSLEPLTRYELAAMRDEVMAVLNRYVTEARSRAEPEGAEQVIVHFHAFPRRRPGDASD